MRSSVIIGTGSYLPSKIISNDDMAQMVDTTHEWIVKRTGICQRHIAGPTEMTSDMGKKAAEIAIQKSGLSKDEIDGIIVATTTPDNTFPSVAAKVQKALGLKQCAAFDVQAVCSGFIYALTIANSLIKSGSHHNILVIGADKMSSIVNWEDRSTCVLFGDGAGAVVLSGKDNVKGVLASEILCDGNLDDILYTSGGVSQSNESGFIIMKGAEVFKHAVEKMSSSVQSVLQKAGLSASEIQWVVPHQANARIINAVAEKLGLSSERVILTVDKHANTSAASIPIALDLECGKFKRGENVLFTAAGAGFTWGSLVLSWY